jgi:hypothetical protein
MCPFCVATAVWIAAGAVSTGGLSALAIKLSQKKPNETQPIAETRSQP